MSKKLSEATLEELQKELERRKRERQRESQSISSQTVLLVERGAVENTRMQRSLQDPRSQRYHEGWRLLYAKLATSGLPKAMQAKLEKQAKTLVKAYSEAKLSRRDLEAGFRSLFNESRRNPARSRQAAAEADRELIEAFKGLVPPGSDRIVIRGRTDR